ncbi:hypothetical protein [Leptospira sp. GIMC2001]|uniref:hypothetical protein n=1 Tax=Leptospira sp. GIMC2001 TaxID=1513297 RepID=UPI002348FE4B|nr:hypothetical protein [Leptospira sp. GIMC2001]WCL50770.1 hypothetical protein O4O04_08140 [Leptospira sp. GIMC2001]
MTNYTKINGKFHAKMATYPALKYFAIALGDKLISDKLLSFIEHERSGLPLKKIFLTQNKLTSILRVL